MMSEIPFVFRMICLYHLFPCSNICFLSIIAEFYKPEMYTSLRFFFNMIWKILSLSDLLNQDNNWTPIKYLHTLYFTDTMFYL